MFLLANQVLLPHGVLFKSSEGLVMEIPLKETNVQDLEQLKELEKQDSLFLSCTKQELKPNQIVLHYHLEEGFQPLETWDDSSMYMKQKFAQGIISVKKIEGTQFTTYMHPENIYCNQDGKVKFIYRGIRSVLPPEQEDGKVFVYQIKCIILSIFSGMPYFDLLNNGIPLNSFNDRALNQLAKAKSLKDIEVFLAKDLSEINTKRTESSSNLKSTKENHQSTEQKNSMNFIKSEPDLSIPAMKPNLSLTSEETLSISTNKSRKVLWLSGAGFLVLGLIIGLLSSYILQVKPNSVASASNLEEKNKIEKKLQIELDEKENHLAAYQLTAMRKNEEAIQAFEAIKRPSDDDKKVLANLYLALNTPDSLMKAAELDSSLQVQAAKGLVKLKSEEANKALLSIETMEPEILLEQAWLEKNYQQVTALAGDELKDSERANVLAANGLLEEGNSKEAYSFAKKTRDVPLKIKILDKQLKNIKADKSLSKKEKEKETKLVEKEQKKIKNVKS